MVVARVAHFDPRCPVCSVGTPGIFTTGAVVPPPFPNPAYRARPKKDEKSEGGQHGHTWYHGTHFSPEEDDEDEHDPVVQDAGGRLKTPESDSEPGSRAEEHWNTDLGVHFTSLHHVAKDLFAKPQSGDIDSRVAHATLHMQNPKHFDSEHDMTHDAIGWAQKNGLHYLPQHPRAHEEFENGHYAGVADHDKSGAWDEVNPTSMPRMREQREAMSHIDRNGPSWEKGDPDEDDKERYLATHPRRATLTEGYRQHLQSQGHDGVVYGNEHEGPQGHASAIAFPDTPVAIHKWEWLHPDHGRPADAQESAERARTAPSNRQLKLFGATGWPSDQTLFDEAGPTASGKHTLSLIHSRHGEVGSTEFYPHEDPVRIHMIHVNEAHRGKGYARMMADELQRRYPDVAADHGHKTEMGQGFWDAYSKGKPEDLVQKGRTAANMPHIGSGSDHGPQTAAVYRVHHAQGISSMHPALAQSPGETPREAGQTLQGMLRHLGHPDADYAFVIRHPKPEKGISSPVYSDGDPGVALHPKQWTNEYLGHEAAHLMENHVTGREVGTPLEDDANHGAGFQGHLRSVFNYLSPPTKDFGGAGDDFLDHVQHHMNKTSKIATSGWNFEHFHTEGQHWRSFGGPPESPRQHALEYKVRPEGTLDFSQSSMNDYYAKKSGPEVHARMRQNALEHHDTTEHDPASEKPAEAPKQRRVYYHGTTVPDVTHILPASQHGQGVVFHSDTSPDHAYASTKLGDAWDYAQKAYDHKMNGRPRVYQVRPMGGHQNVEKDPEWNEATGRHRGNNESDFRSKHGFEVVREMKPPKHVRDSYTDEEWGED